MLQALGRPQGGHLSLWICTLTWWSSCEKKHIHTNRLIQKVLSSSKHIFWGWDTFVPALAPRSLHPCPALPWILFQCHFAEVLCVCDESSVGHGVFTELIMLIMCLSLPCSSKLCYLSRSVTTVRNTKSKSHWFYCRCAYSACFDSFRKSFISANNLLNFTQKFTSAQPPKCAQNSLLCRLLAWTEHTDFCKTLQYPSLLSCLKSSHIKLAGEFYNDN